MKVAMGDVKIGERLATISEKVTSIEIVLSKIEAKLESDYPTRKEMDARLESMGKDLSILQKLVYGTVSLILTSVVGSVMFLVLNKGK